MIGGHYILSRQTYQILYEVVSWLSLTKFPENLKKVNNALSNSSSGIIGISRQKEFVLKWNLIKHEKLKHVQFIDNICDTSEEVNGFSPYHEFFCKTIASEEIYVNFIFRFLHVLVTYLLMMIFKILLLVKFWTKNRLNVFFSSMDREDQLFQVFH